MGAVGDEDGGGLALQGLAELRPKDAGVELSGLRIIECRLEYPRRLIQPTDPLLLQANYALPKSWE